MKEREVLVPRFFSIKPNSGGGIKTVSLSNGTFVLCPKCGTAMMKGFMPNGYKWVCISCDYTLYQKAEEVEG
jgi:ribosomal protein S27AE